MALLVMPSLLVPLGLVSAMSKDGVRVCNATVRRGQSIGGDAYHEFSSATFGECCSACQSDARCKAFVTSRRGQCFLKADLSGPHPKATNDCGIVRAPPAPSPAPSPAPPPPPPGSPAWEVVAAMEVPAIGDLHPDVAAHTIRSGFETGQFFRRNGTYYLSVNELGVCPHNEVMWDLVTRAALWSAPSSAGPWKRLITLRNGSHMQTLCEPKVPCAKPCGGSCCSGTADEPSFVTWAPTLIHGPSSVNGSGNPVWNFFYSSNQNSHYHDDAFNGITWAVSQTDSILGPFVDVAPAAGTGLLPGGEGVVNVAVKSSHSFSAWQLRNGSWVGFRNNVPGAKSFSAGLIAPTGDSTVPGGPWRPAGPNIASGSDCNAGFCFAPENPVVTTMTTDGKYFVAVYDSLESPGGAFGGDYIGLGFSEDGVSWRHSSILAVQNSTRRPCGAIRTPLGLVPVPEQCDGCYAVLWTGVVGNFRPVCQAIIRNVNEID